MKKLWTLLVAIFAIVAVGCGSYEETADTPQNVSSRSNTTIITPGSRLNDNFYSKSNSSSPSSTRTGSSWSSSSRTSTPSYSSGSSSSGSSSFSRSSSSSSGGFSGYGGSSFGKSYSTPSSGSSFGKSWKSMTPEFGTSYQPDLSN